MTSILNKKIFQYLLLILTTVIQISCSSSMTHKTQWPSTENGNLVKLPHENCAVKQQLLSTISLNEDMVCIAEVAFNMICEQKILSQPQEKYVAIPLEKNNCSGLSLQRDFFSTSIYNNDPYYLKIFKRVATLLRKEIKTPSQSFISLGHKPIKELTRLQMSAISTFRADLGMLANTERYQIMFYLPTINVTIVLAINQDSSNPEWGLLLD